MNSLLNLNGFLIINKPKNWTSFDVVKKVRNLLHAKKVGHTGTLDPMATGVLVLCFGRATREVSKIMGMDKEYVGEVTLGATSNTDDADGQITPNSNNPKDPGLGVIEKLLEEFKGTIEQIPPQFSAKKVEGQRAYKLARKGQLVELKPNLVTVHKIEILDYFWPKLKIRVQCGKGFYMRSLARDIGAKLGTGGYLSELKRTRVGKYPIEQAITIEQVTAARLLPIS